MNFIEGEIFYFNKPLYWTSFDLVGKVRRMICRHLGIKKLKVGHAGTLDPLASGVMIVCTGRKTKLIDTFQYQTKEYIAKLQLGATTPSYDLEHPVDKTYPTKHITGQLVDTVVSSFKGEIWQIPPTYSAVKIDGKRAYSYAREGKEIELKAKLLVIDEIEILDFNAKLMQLTIRVVCSKGTYIRALARDIGEALHSGAHLIELCRTRIGDVSLENCITIEQFTDLLNAEIPASQNV